jgi:hypothetical protein
VTQVLGTSTYDDGVKVVQVAVVRRTGTRCKQLAARATFVTSSCRKPTGFLTATGKRAWRLVLPRVLSYGSTRSSSGSPTPPASRRSGHPAASAGADSRRATALGARRTAAGVLGTEVSQSIAADCG